MPSNEAVGRRPWIFRFIYRWRRKIIFSLVLQVLCVLHQSYFNIFDFGEDKILTNRPRREISKSLHVADILRFPKTYHATGVLRLPYGGIVEPFEAWYSKKNQRSRIDYYGGMDVTYQREDIGNYGFAAKIVPEFSEQKQKTFRGCLHRVGTKRFPIHAQSIVPSPLFFKYDGNCTINGRHCAKWVHSFTVMNKQNSYTLYTTRSNPPLPIRYEMMGYDTLLTSYYDHYVLDYKIFEHWKYDEEKFRIPKGLKCFSFLEKIASEGVSSYSPMLEFIPHHLKQLKANQLVGGFGDESELRLEELDEDVGNNQLVDNSYEHVLTSLFASFKRSYKKNYKDTHEHETRKDIFRHNLRYISAVNRQHLGYKLKMNKFADMTEKEVDSQKGLLDEPEGTFNGGKQFHAPPLPKQMNIPESMDWRDYGAVTPVRSQGICGSCYAYAVTGAMEGAYFLKTGKLVDLSEQEIVDCTWGFGNRGCKGGYPYRAMQWIIKHKGIATEEHYGHYLAQEGYCHFMNTSIGVRLGSYMNVTSGNATELKMAIALYGPVTVLINTKPKSFKFYSEGVYYDEDCDHSLDHAALAIGYGVEKGHSYWLIKNSWSASWGIDGYIKISAKNDNCGVTQKAVIVHITHDVNGTINNG